MVIPMAQLASGASASLPSFTDKYDIERVLGRGGMGTVFEARHARLGHRVAIKVLAVDLCVHAELVTRFEREARAASALSSPHAARVFDIETTADGVPFMVMELLSGCDLAKTIEREGPQPIGRSIRWMLEACHAIAEAHSLGIVHRDIKPSNLLLCDDNSIKVLDFGIAKHLPSPTSPIVDVKEAAITMGLTPLGTPQYMSPEQVRCAKEVDARTDIWSLGVTLYELVCGRPPFNHDIAQACLAAIVADPVPDPRSFRPDLPDAVAESILRALDKEPDERFATIEELVEALAPFSDEAVSPLKESGSWGFVRSERGDTVSRNPTLTQSDTPPRARPSRTTPTKTAASQIGWAARGRRFRGAVALVTAVATGLVTLVSTPRFRRSEAEATKSAVAVTARRAEAPTTSHVALSSPVVLPEAAPSGVTFGPPAPPPIDSASGALKTLKLHPAASVLARRLGDQPVHGGLSGPGF
jgi:serine/threonine-protein kinase